jgi:hypothetical protein
MEERLRRIAERARMAQADRIAIPAPTRRVVVDPAAIADALLAKRRLTRTVDRAREADEPHLREWEVETRQGETLREAMERTLAESMPPAVAVSRPASLRDLRTAYLALSPDERADEVARHLWAMEEATRVRTVYAPLLCAMGVGVDR